LIAGAAPVLIDFGLSTRFPGSTGREAIDSQRDLAGTLPYMSPEQLRGELVDARSDLYSVGCILYELLVGAPPFTGSPFSIRTQHLSSAPAPPSHLVGDVPPALETLVLRLLSKDPTDRVSFADEVAATLAEISGDDEPLPDFPTPRPYLYRPRFVGRADALAKLMALRDAACAGCGAIALVGGESGGGKTRLALELTRVRADNHLRIVASESTSVAPEQYTTAAASALNAVRPLLRAMADRCQEGGAETTAVLLGQRRSVLALYEPLLAEVPAHEPLASVVPLDPEASRQRLLRYLAQSLTAFAQEQPILWILDDLGWADELSLAFLHSLSREYWSTTPALLVGTYRTEESTDALRALADQPHVVHLALPRLGPLEVAAMVADMLAASAKQAEFAAYVADAADGNPFFVTEHVRTAVNEGLFYRDHDHSWHMRVSAANGRVDYEGLPLPRSLRVLLERRLSALTHVAQEVARVAAVVGRESALEVITDVAALPQEVTAAAIDELIRRHVFEQPAPERLRFVHDKLREAAYAAPGEDLRGIHARVAATLERYWQGRPDAAEGWATLGHHFAAAEQPEPAARYFKQAAEHARSIFANAEAVALYRRAIAQLRESPHRTGTEAGACAHDAALVDLHEALGEILALVGEREAARAAFATALDYSGEDQLVERARLHRKTGNTWEGCGAHSLALELYARAREMLPARCDPAATRVCDEWIQTRFDELRVNYWLARSQGMEELVGELRPVIEAHGTPQQLAGFYQSLVFHCLGRERYLVSADTLALSEVVFRACAVQESPNRAWAYFQRGFTLLLAFSVPEAESHLAAALQLAERAGDIVNQTRAALYLAVAARMRGSVAEVPPLSLRAARIAREARMHQYAAAAKGTDAWLCVRRGDMAAALELTDEALTEMTAYGGVYPFHWLVLVPRLEAQIALGRMVDGVESCRALLATDQRKLPVPIEEQLAEAIAAWDAPDPQRTRALAMLAVKSLASRGLQ
jgi:tetratricopeptide (TPR) repeat protein